MSQSQKSQASLTSFFKPAQPASSSSSYVPPSNQQPKAAFKAPTNFPHPAFRSSEENYTLSQQSYTSSLSPPPSSPVDHNEVPISPLKPVVVSSSAAGRVIKSSDDEDEDSDISLEDLATILKTNRAHHPNGTSPSTPNASRTKNVAFHISPMPILNKKKFDLKSLASYAEMDRKTEASSKRVKAMQEASEKQEFMSPRGDSASEKLKHSTILQDVVADQEDADISKVARAVMRTEATLSEQRWYFFDTQGSPPKPRGKPFPTRSPKEWKSDLQDAQMRDQTFVSGFAEDMVSFGKALPDEIFIWILDELCVETSEPLRASYCNVVKQSSEQVRRLLVPNVIRDLFESVGATSANTAITDKVCPVQALSTPYANRDWSRLRSLVVLLGQISKTLQARTYAVTLLLRMCCDRMVMENVDIFDAVQDTIDRLCRYVPDDSWESSPKCQIICTTLYDSVSQPILRLQMVQCIPSTSSRSHDLKRRLAMSFYFNSPSYSATHSHLMMDLGIFTDRLEDRDFDTDAQTDYRELAALIQLLNFALDDGRSIGLDLTDEKSANQYDRSIDELSGIIKGIMSSIGNPGAAFISRIEAKEGLELVSQRISDTLRSKPKAKLTVFDRKKYGQAVKSLDGEKKFMSSFFKT
ncbi:hypothetical protein D0Z07_1681 [Hyphodiscus hymeniophilus]|uniref:Uncharacterized protein n=1 Tax=Hyphodiscus hymeniophilus TaxID=353542 RepID=A0A9P7B068_9HELO|nr:hypothetical protein D0Z07_1681 [Hyphodiscus hymeniophilus]